MSLRGGIAAAAAVAALLTLGAASASAVAPNPNPWLQMRFLNIAHQGGEDEAPSNTMFAFKTAIADRGADMPDEPDGEASDARFLRMGIDGYMSSQPSRLHAFLCAQEVPRPDGSDRCP